MKETTHGHPQNSQLPGDNIVNINQIIEKRDEITEQKKTNNDKKENNTKDEYMMVDKVNKNLHYIQSDIPPYIVYVQKKDSEDNVAHLIGTSFGHKLMIDVNGIK